MRQDKALATWTGDKLDIQVLEPKMINSAWRRWKSGDYRITSRG
jgi:hypothetical protein